MAGHANLTLRKTLAGSLTADELTAVRAGLTFTVTRSDGTAVAVISGADMTVGTDPAQCSYTIQDLPMASESGTPYTYTVTETAHAAPAAVLYLASRAAVNGDVLQPAGDPPTLANITLLQNGTTYADFENTYARQTGSLRLTKAVDDAALRDEAEAVTNTFTVGSLPIGSYTLVYDDGTARTVTLDAPGALTVPLRGLHSVTVEDVPVGSYTVTETDHPDLAGWYCTTIAAAAAGTVQVPSGGVGEAVITNTYAPFLRVTVTKQVTGGMGDTRRGFAFAAAIDGAAVTADTPYVQPYGGAALTADGFTIPHKGSIVIGHLKPGQTVTVTEETLTDYETTMDDGSSVTLGRSYTATLTGDTAVTCVNIRTACRPRALRRTRPRQSGCWRRARRWPWSAAAEGRLHRERDTAPPCAGGREGGFFLRAGALAALLLVLFGVVFGLAIQPDDTMYPHLKPGDLLLYYRLPRSFAAGEVVVFTQDDRRCTGRVAARGGDTVEVTENALLRINGSLVAEPDIYETTPRYDSDVTYPLTLADGEYFILCDAREGAPDSRRYGPVTAENIAGRVIAIVRRNEI